MRYKEFIVDHVTFSQSGGGFIVVESFQSFKRSSIRERCCCVNGSKRQFYIVLLLVRHNIRSCFIDKAMA